MNKKLALEELGPVDTGPGQDWWHWGPSGSLIGGEFRAHCGEVCVNRGPGARPSNARGCPDCQRIYPR